MLVRSGLEHFCADATLRMKGLLERIRLVGLMNDSLLGDDEKVYEWMISMRNELDLIATSQV